QGRGGVPARSAIGAHADQRSRPNLQVADENIVDVIGIIGGQVIGVADEGDVAAVGADHRIVRAAIRAGRARAVDAHQDVGGGPQVTDKDVLVVVRVVGRQVVSQAHKRNEPPVRAQRIGGNGTQIIGGGRLDGRVGLGNQFGRVRSRVAHEHVELV